MSTNTTDLDSWYTSRRPLYIDLIGDFGGKELFVVDGDSLLRHVLDDKHLDFDEGFQLLHAVYLIENFLAALKRRKCNFHVVFFDANKPLCIPPGKSDQAHKFLLLRACAIHHLCTSKEDFIYVYESLKDENFQDYLKTHRPYFFMVHDGSSALKQEAFVLRANITQILRMGLHVALVNEVVFQDSRVHTVVFNSAGAEKWLPPDTSTIISKSKTISSKLQKSRSGMFDFKRIPFQSFTTIESLSQNIALSVVKAHPDIGPLELVAGLLFHIAVVGNTPLYKRAEICSTKRTLVENSDKFKEFITKVSSAFLAVIEGNELDRGNLKPDLYDLIDGNAFLCTLDILAAEKWEDHDDILTQEVYEGYILLSRHVPALVDTPLPAIQWENYRCVSKSNEIHPSPKPLELTHFSHPLFDKYFTEIYGPVTPSAPWEADGGLMEPLVTTKGFTDSYHWHNLKKLNDKQVERASARRLRSEQFYMKGMHKYAASLTGAMGNMLEPKLIVVAAGAEAKKKNTKTKETQNTKKAPKEKEKNLSKAEKIKMENTARLVEKRSKSDPFNNLLAENRTTTMGDIITSIGNMEKFEKKLDDVAKTGLSAKITAYKLNLLFQLWCRAVENKTASQRMAEDYDIVGKIFYEVYKLQNSAGMDAGLVAFIEEIIHKLGFSKFTLGKPSTSNGKSSIPKDLLMLYEPLHDNYTIKQPLEDFQLLHCGKYMDRNMGSTPDDRVPFSPDAWQKTVLDSIDAGNGLLVVAPTSAGKTFISFYAMETILRESDDDVIVYVAPTKALVNQIAAEVQSRFRKHYPKTPGKTVWSIHTRDYRINNPTNCQILITVPHILQIMLLSPANANNWSPKVKRIIFDEVHCIGQTDDGVIWEQLLILAPCPVIALSATVGNPEEFGDWIAKAQASVGVKLETVVWKHRYSDLRKYLYTPGESMNQKNSTAITSLAQLDDSNSVKLMHPIFAMKNPNLAVLKDTGLEARECYKLFKALEAEYKQLPRKLYPKKFFKGLVKKADVITWAEELKNVLGELVQTDLEIFRKVRARLAIDGEVKPITAPAGIHTSMEDSNSDSEDLDSEESDTEESDSEGSDMEDQEQNEEATTIKDEIINTNLDAIKSTLPLLRTLQSQNALPALLFSYDRGVCEVLCKTLITQLKSSEEEYRASSPDWVQKLNDWEAWKKSVEDSKKKANKGSGGKRTGTKAEDKVGEAMLKQADSESYGAASRWALFDPTDPDEGFTFANPRSYSKDEFDEDMEVLRKADIPDVFIRGFSRGIGVHHAGLSRKLRECVERLFRNGYLKVVIATGTLALGINVPCATTAFIGDHLYLTSLNYQQASGRAGRRGFDLVGNVLFHGIDVEKVARLMTAKLPSLHGHFPITTTLVLRLFILLGSSNNSEFAKRAVEGLLTQSRLYIGDEEQSFKVEVLHHLRFSIEFLQRHGLLDSRGNPIEFAGLTSHLYYTENSSFAFHALLQQGVFHEICKGLGAGKDPRVVCERLMLVLAHTFRRQPLRQRQTANLEKLKESIKRSPSIVVLPKLEEWIAEVLREQNELTLQIYTSYVETFAENNLGRNADNILPFTQTSIGTSKIYRKPSSLSNFVALSSHPGSYSSIADLAASIRTDIPLEASAVPCLVGSEDQFLNAYLYDFYKHGSLRPLVDANGIRRSDVWFALKDFSLVLATIVSSLRIQLGLAEDGDGEFSVEVEDEDDGPEDDDEFVVSSYTGSSSSAAKGNAKAWVDVLNAFTMLRREFDEKLLNIGSTKKFTGTKSKKPSMRRGANDTTTKTRSGKY